MLSRVLEPEVMDSPDEARDYDAMDHAEVNRVFVADFLAAWSGEMLILDVGTGTAQIPIELCRQQPALEVVAIDLAGSMLAIARHNVQQAGLDHRIQLERQDAKHLPFVDGSFAAVISNSIVHHIPKPAEVFSEMARVSAPGGLIFVRDLLRPTDSSTREELVQRYAGMANRHQQQMFRASFDAALTLEEARQEVTRLGFLAQAVQQTSDRHWTWCARRSERGM